jgi:DNA gyrase/topoisomerase IV subunit A
MKRSIKKLAELYKLIVQYKKILNDRNALLTQIKDELKDIKDKVFNS